MIENYTSKAIRQPTQPAPRLINHKWQPKEPK